MKKKYIEQKPWGQFEQFVHNQPVTVKIITVNPHQALSLQYHHNREEFWRVIFGIGEIIVGDITYQAKEGDEFFITQKQKHRIQTNDCPIKVLEISFGNFDENDIVRLEDKYCREK